jgi:hypothetical protein
MNEMSFTARIEMRKKISGLQASLLSSHHFLRASEGDFKGWEIIDVDFVLFDASTQRLVAAFFTDEEELLRQRDSAIKFFGAMHKHHHHFLRHSVAQGGKCYGKYSIPSRLTTPRPRLSWWLSIGKVIRSVC